MSFPTKPDDRPTADATKPGRVTICILSVADPEVILNSETEPAGWIRLMQEERPRQPVAVQPDQGAPPARDAGRLAFGLSKQSARSRLRNSRRRSRARRVGADVVLGLEAKLRATTDAGSLLGKSPSALGTAAQKRTPIMTDTRVRGGRVGQLVASGSHWVPARFDLDTILSKIDSRIIENMIVIKGPYSARYGPGFQFVDVELIGSPRYADGYESHQSTSLNYLTNGEQWFGRQSVWGGSDAWGFHASYGHRTGSDYETGGAADGSLFEPKSLPTSYKSRDVEFALGFDPAPHSHLEFIYLRLDQTDVEFPGLVNDIRFLVTDGYELKYVHQEPTFADEATIEGWYNRTRFEGDNLGSGKRRQIPAIALTSDIFIEGRTDVDALSTGYRMDVTWGQQSCPQVTVGTDLLYLQTELNDIATINNLSNMFVDLNFPIPRSYSLDVGLFVEHSLPVNNRLTVNCGVRIDWINTDAANSAPKFAGTPFGQTVADVKVASLDQHFDLWAAFATAAYALDDYWTATGGVGFAQRAPTLTELYAIGSFIGSLQPGFTYLTGDPELTSERLKQIDFGLEANYPDFRGGVDWFYAWIENYVTYHLYNGKSPFPGGFPTGAFFVNTDLAVLTGVEMYGEYDVCNGLSTFATLSYLQGQDRTRLKPARLARIQDAIDGTNIAETRSNNATIDQEPLPGIPPLDARLGVRLHDPSPDTRWGVEVSARVVDNQDRAASTLDEIETPGFTIWDVRIYGRPTDNLLLTAGVENLTDKFYREHLDFRTGRGVFQPGVNFYFGTELTY